MAIIMKGVKKNITPLPSSLENENLNEGHKKCWWSVLECDRT